MGNDFDILFNRADVLIKTEDPCKIKNGTCTGCELNPNKRICNVCSDKCAHFNRTCTINNILCKAWTCPEIEHLLSKEFIKEQEDIIKEAVKSGYGLYCLTEEEIENGVESPISTTSNKRIENLIS